jgi:hypothetical protein
LTGPVEGKDGVAALLGAASTDEVHLLRRNVVTGVDDQQWARTGHARCVEIPVQRRALEWDLDRSNRVLHQRRGITEALDVVAVEHYAVGVGLSVAGEEFSAAPIG